MTLTMIFTCISSSFVTAYAAEKTILEVGDAHFYASDFTEGTEVWYGAYDTGTHVTAKTNESDGAEWSLGVTKTGGSITAFNLTFLANCELTRFNETGGFEVTEPYIILNNTNAALNITIADGKSVYLRSKTFEESETPERYYNLQSGIASEEGAVSITLGENSELTIGDIVPETKLNGADNATRVYLINEGIYAPTGVKIQGAEGSKLTIYDASCGISCWDNKVDISGPLDVEIFDFGRGVACCIDAAKLQVQDATLKLTSQKSNGISVSRSASFTDCDITIETDGDCIYAYTDDTFNIGHGDEGYDAEVTLRGTTLDAVAKGTNSCGIYAERLSIADSTIEIEADWRGINLSPYPQHSENPVMFSDSSFVIESIGTDYTGTNMNDRSLDEMSDGIFAGRDLIVKNCTVDVSSAAGDAVDVDRLHLLNSKLKATANGTEDSTRGYGVYANSLGFYMDDSSHIYLSGNSLAGALSHIQTGMFLEKSLSKLRGSADLNDSNPDNQIEQYMSNWPYGFTITGTANYAKTISGGGEPYVLDDKTVNINGKAREILSRFVNSAMDESDFTERDAKIYFGKDSDDNPLLYRAIGVTDQKGSRGVPVAERATDVETFFAENKYSSGMFWKNNTDYKNYYAGSNLQLAMEECTAKLTEAEKSVVKARTLATGGYLTPPNITDGIADAAAVSGAVMWPLSAFEADALDDTGFPQKEATDYSGNPLTALRSPGEFDDDIACFMNDGHLVEGKIDFTYDFQPAFNLDLSKVVMVSKFDKTTGAVTDYNGNWKLTLADAARKDFTAEFAGISGTTLSVKYSGAVANADDSTNERIAFIITDSTGETVSYYGSVLCNAVSGTVELTLPKAPLDEGDKVFVFSEQNNGDKKTDLAGPFVEIPIEYHTHALTFSADANTITATCSNTEGCPFDDGNGNYSITLTLSADGGTYDGTTAYPATTDDATVKFTSATKTTAVIGYAKGDNAIEGAPVNAGTYTAKLTLKDSDSQPVKNGDAVVTATKEFTVEKATVAVPSENSTSFTYDGNEKTYMTVADNALYKLTDDSAATSRTAAGTTTIKLTLKDTDNYKWENDASDPSYTFTIAKADQTITADTPQSFVYLDTGKSVTASALDDAALSYAVKSGESVTVDESTGALAVVKAGDTVITVTAAETDNYNSATKDVTVTIGKKELAKPTAVEKTYTYTGEPQTFELTNFVADTMTISGNKQTDASIDVYPDGCPVTVTLKDTDNYKWSTEGDCSFKWVINKAPQSAPVITAVTGEVVTVNAGDRDRALQYCVDDAAVDASKAWLDVPGLSADGTFTLPGLTQGNHTLYMRVNESKNYLASESSSKDFTLDHYRVEYNANGGTGAPAAVEKTSPETVAAAALTTLKRTGYTAAGWNTQPDGTGTPYAPEAILSDGAVLYAQWTPNTYTVKFDANGGEGTMEDQDFVFDQKNALNNNLFSRVDYTFKGWATSPAGAVEYTNGQQVKNLASSGEVTLYAVWTQKTYQLKVNVTSPRNAAVNIKVVKGNTLFAQPSPLSLSGDPYTGATYIYGLMDGVYNVIVTQNLDIPGDPDRVESAIEIVTISGANAEVDFTLTDGNVSAELEVRQGTPNVMVNGLTEEAQENREGTSDVRVKMIVEQQEERELLPTATAEERETQTAIKEIKNVAAKDVLNYMNITIEKTNIVENVARPPVRIDTTTNVMEIAVSFDSAEKYEIQIFRYHGDSAERFRKLSSKPDSGFEDGTFYIDEENGLIYIYAKKFSTYAIGYDLEPHTDPGFDHASAYPIYVNSTENGNVSLSNNRSVSGKTVIVTVDPDAGFMIGRVLAKDENGNAVSVKELGGGRYSFVMPSSAVTVHVMFELVSSAADCPRDETCPIEPFGDTENDYWWHDGVHYCIENELMIGVAEKEFAPLGDTSRAMITTILWRLSGSPVVDHQMTFEDVEENEWYTEAIRWAQSVELVTGYDEKTFGPKDVITREQMMTIFCRYYKFRGFEVLSDYDLSVFTDCESVSPWAEEGVKWAVNMCVIQGSGNAIEPQITCNRAQAACIVQRFCEMFNLLDLSK